MLAIFSVAASAVRSAAAVAWVYRSYGLASKCAEEACCCLPDQTKASQSLLWSDLTALFGCL